MFQHAIVRTPCKNVLNGITSAPELGKPDYEKALVQHAAYIRALEQCGVDVTVLPADEAYPDSCKSCCEIWSFKSFSRLCGR